VINWGGYRCATANKKAIVVVAHAQVVIISLERPGHRKAHHELGTDYFTRRLDPERENPPTHRQAPSPRTHRDRPASRLTKSLQQAPARVTG
jgi:hypothetical protein